MNWDPSLSSLLAIEEENQETTMSREARHRFLQLKKKNVENDKELGGLLLSFASKEKQQRMMMNQDPSSSSSFATKEKNTKIRRQAKKLVLVIFCN